MDSLEALESNYFDYSFQPKVIARYQPDRWFAPGAHFLVDPLSGDRIESAEIEGISAAHMPFASIQRLEKRAQRGIKLRDSGVEREFAWQSQMVGRVHEEGRLAHLWQSHSMAEFGVSGETIASSPEVHLAATLELTLDKLSEAWGGALNSEGKIQVPDLALDVDIANRMLVQIARMRQFVSHAIAESQDQIAKAIRHHNLVVAAMEASRSWKAAKRIRKYGTSLRKSMQDS
jgi:hypothetical protein